MKRSVDQNPAPIHRAFTLLEMLAATALAAVVVAVVLSSLQIGFAAEAAARRRVEPWQQLAVAVDLIQDDLAAALPVSGELVTECTGQDEQDASGFDHDSLSLFTSVVPGPWLDHPAGLRRVWLGLVGPDQDGHSMLVRQVTANVLAPIEPQPDQQILCRRVEALNLRYHDGSDWVDSWLESSQRNALPTAVELTIALQRAEGQEPGNGPKLTTILMLPCGGQSTSSAGGQLLR